MWMRTTCVVLVAGLLLAATATSTTADSEDEPYYTDNEWTGFISCAVATPAVAIMACGLIDQNDDFIHHFGVGEDLQTLVAVLEWETHTLPEASLLLLVEDTGSDGSEPGHARDSGGSPIIVRIDDLDSEQPHELQFRVFADHELQVVYQQQFTVTWFEFYGEEAPEDFDPLTA